MTSRVPRAGLVRSCRSARLSDRRGRDELPPQWFAGRLLERCPSLLCVSSIGAGYDTVDVAACTQAGVLVVNQSGGNAQSVAEQTIGMMLDVSRRISEGDRLLRRERGFTREDVMGRQMSGKVVGLSGSAISGASLPRWRVLST